MHDASLLNSAGGVLATSFGARMACAANCWRTSHAIFSSALLRVRKEGPACHESIPPGGSHPSLGGGGGEASGILKVEYTRDGVLAVAVV